MKTLISTHAVALALAFTGPAFAGGGDPTAAKTEADCTTAGGVWDVCDEQVRSEEAVTIVASHVTKKGHRPRSAPFS